MELTLDEQGLIANYRRLSESAKKEVANFAASLHRAAKAAAADEQANTGSCKLVREEERPETAAEPIVTE